MKLIPLGSNQTLVTIDDSHYYFSYNTCVAVRNKEGEFRIQSPSITTSRHMNKMGVSNFLLVSEQELARHIPTTKLPPLTK